MRSITLLFFYILLNSDCPVRHVYLIIEYLITTLARGSLLERHYNYSIHLMVRERNRETAKRHHMKMLVS